MQRFRILPSLLVACFVTGMLAQTPAAAPQPDPEMKKLAILAGHWTYEGEFKPGPLGPGSKVTGEYTGQMILGGFFFQGLMTQKGPDGELREQLDFEGYDPANKTIAASIYHDDGAVLAAVVTVSGNTVTWTGKFTVAGKEYMYKAPIVHAPDLMSSTEKVEISADGNTWVPFFEAHYTKTKPGSKK